MKKSKKHSKKNGATDPLAGDLSYLFNEENIKKWQRVRFELQPKSKSITLRIAEDLLTAVKTEAEKNGIDYQKYIRLILEEAVRKTS